MEKLKNYINRNWMIILLVIAAIVPVMFYVYKFGGYELSNNPSDWGVFGDYIGGVYSVVIAILVVYLTRNLERRDEEKKLKQEAVRKVYLQITSIQQNQRVNQNKLTKLYRLIEESKLFIDGDLYNKIIALANQFGEKGRNRQMEKDLLEELKDEYAAH